MTKPPGLGQAHEIDFDRGQYVARDRRGRTVATFRRLVDAMDAHPGVTVARRAEVAAKNAGRERQHPITRRRA